MRHRHRQILRSFPALCLVFAASVSAAMPGELDLAFSGDGKLTDWSGPANAVAIQADGKIVVAGSINDNGSFAVARYNPDGSSDSDFGGGDGKVTTDIGYYYENASAIALQPNGKIVVVGTTWDGPENQSGHFSLVRYNYDGSLDLSFGGGDGVVVTENLGTRVAANAAAIQADGKIVVAGAGDYLSDDLPYLTVIRYTEEGTLDTSFHDDGIGAIPNFGDFEGAHSVAIQSNGKIVVAGNTLCFPGIDCDWALARYNIDGTFDTTFGGDGIVTTSLGSRWEASHSVAIQLDGKIVAAGQGSNGSDLDFALVRYNPNGSLDTTFDGDGIVTTPIGSGPDIGFSVVIQPDGKVVAAGTRYNDPNNDFAVIRYNTEGSLDLAFGGGDGKATVDFAISDDNARAMVLDGDGRGVVVGDSTGRFAIARFHLYSPITAVSVSGRVTMPSGLGLRNSVVSITYTSGLTRTATTSSFGFYQFDNIPTGETYTISVSSRRYRFAPRSMTINDNLTNIDFVGLE